MAASGGIGVTALLPTTGPTLFDADRGPAGTPPGYPGGGAGMSVVRVGKSAVLTAHHDNDLFDVFVYTGPASPPRSLGRAWSVAPGVDDVSVWVIRQDAPDSCAGSSTCGSTAARSATASPPAATPRSAPRRRTVS